MNGSPARVDSLAWRMQAAGRRTICLHPFDPRFYGRRHVIPALGFQRFIGPDAFSGAERKQVFLDDGALARAAAEILAAEGPDLFLFVISIGNHGPWLSDRGPEDGAPLPEPLRALPEAEQLRRYLGGLRRTDAVFSTLTTSLRQHSYPGLLLAYGDHQPSLPKLFDALNHHGTETDYLLWDAAMPPAPPRAAVRLAVAGLPQLVLDQLNVTHHGAAA